MRIKSAFFCSLIVASSLLLAGCTEVLTVFGESEGDSSVRRTFWASDFTTDEFYEVEAELLAESGRAIVYAELDSGVSPAAAQSAATEFDRRIYDLIRTNFAEESDVDNNGKIILLLLDIRDGFDDSGGYVAGYFHGHHALELSNSNRADMIFMDINPGVVGDPTFRETMAHEFQHLVNFAEEFIRGGGGRQDTWVDEGLSSAAEYLYAGGHIQSKIDYYNDDPNGTIAQGQGFLTWGAWGDILVDYSTVYLFFQWLRIHADGGAGVYRDILDNEHTDYRAVLETYQSEVDNAAGSWDEVITNWYLANLLQTDSGVRGYEGELSLSPPFLTERSDYDTTFEGKPFPLYPGGGIFLKIGSSPYNQPPPANLTYLGIDTDVSPAVVDRDATGGFEGDTLLMVHVRGEDSTSLLTQTDDLPAATLLAPPALSSSSITPTPEVYPIDLRHTLTGEGGRQARPRSKSK